jgi:hypothetical protein
LPCDVSLPTQFLPDSSGCLNKHSHGRPCPFAQPPLQGCRHYYEQVRRRTPRRYSVPYGFDRLGYSLSLPLWDGSVGARLLTFRVEAADQAHVTSMPGTA